MRGLPRRQVLYRPVSYDQPYHDAGFNDIDVKRSGVFRRRTGLVGAIHALFWYYDCESENQMIDSDTENPDEVEKGALFLLRIRIPTHFLRLEGD